MTDCKCLCGHIESVHNGPEDDIKSCHSCDLCDCFHFGCDASSPPVAQIQIGHF